MSERFDWILYVETRYAIGGLSGGEAKDQFWRVVEQCTADPDGLPADKPRSQRERERERAANRPKILWSFDLIGNYLRAARGLLQLSLLATSS